MNDEPSFRLRLTRPVAGLVFLRANRWLVWAGLAQPLPPLRCAGPPPNLALPARRAARGAKAPLAVRDLIHFAQDFHDAGGPSSPSERGAAAVGRLAVRYRPVRT